MTVLRPQLFYTAKLSRSLAQGGGENVIYLDHLPDETAGALIIEPKSKANRELITYTGIDLVNKRLTGVTRGRYFSGSTVGNEGSLNNQPRHSSGSDVEMNNGYYERELADKLGGLVIIGNSLTVEGQLKAVYDGENVFDAVNLGQLERATQGGYYNKKEVVLRAIGVAGQNADHSFLIESSVIENNGGFRLTGYARGVTNGTGSSSMLNVTYNGEVIIPSTVLGTEGGTGVVRFEVVCWNTTVSNQQTFSYSVIGTTNGFNTTIVDIGTTYVTTGTSKYLDVWIQNVEGTGTAFGSLTNVTLEKFNPS